MQRLAAPGGPAPGPEAVVPWLLRAELAGLSVALAADAWRLLVSPDFRNDAYHLPMLAALVWTVVLKLRALGDAGELGTPKPEL